MANEEQLEILKQGVDVWNKWREENPDVEIDFSDCSFFGENLQRANFSKADLSQADLLFANLEFVDFRGANLFTADLIGSNLGRANLNGTYLMGADLTSADLDSADLSETNISFAEFANVTLVNNDLRSVIGLETIVHSGPSSIGMDTVRLSQGKISADFLRGCGLSDWEIEYAKLYDPELNDHEIYDIFDRAHKLRTQQSQQFSPLFISYSHADSPFIEKLEEQLNKKGIRFWRDAHDAKAERLEKQIERAIRQYPTVLLVLSESSIKSDWVQHEVRTARELEKELGRDTLCPIALDDSWKSSPWPKRVMEQVMEYNVLDFSEWEDDSKFEGMFRRLIDGLELFYKK